MRLARGRRLASRLWQLSLCALVTAGFGAWGFAGSGSVVVLPVAGAKIKTGLRLEVNTEWIEGNGYRPVRLRISPLGGGPSPADRRLRVRVQPRSWQWGVELTAASTTVELPQGATFGEVILPIPQHESWGSISVETHEDGQRCDDLSARSLGLARTGSYGWSEAAPAILILDSDALVGYNARFPTQGKKVAKPERLPDVRSLGALFLINIYGGVTYDSNDFDTSEDFDDNDVLRLVSALPRMDIVPTDGLPRNWIDFTSADVILISLADLEQVARGASWPAIRTWLSTGPTLCVYGVGEDFARLEDLERLIGLPPTEDQGDWVAPSRQDYANEVHALRNVNWNTLAYVQPMVVTTQRPRRQVTPTTNTPSDPKPFLIRGVEQGRVVAIAAEDPFPGTREDWCWLFNTLSNQDWMWYQRHGLSFYRDNADYWNLLIPGVGDAPVNSFLVLISLFVIVIGPVNYFMLQRRRRLYLLLLTVPLGAGLITAALFIYAVVDDGLGVRVRARSLTTLDQNSGRAVTWSRQSYYAGLAPSAGMSFPLDVAVYPLDSHCRGNHGRPRDFGRQVNWHDSQQLASGYLNSRSTSQMVVIESQATEARLEIDERDSSVTPRVTNKLGAEIEQLLLRDSSDRLLAANELPSGQTVQLHEVEVGGLVDRWNKLFVTHRPRVPEGFDPTQMENAAAIFGTATRWWQSPDQGLPDPSTSTSILERGLRAVSTLRVQDLKPRQYIAVMRTSPLMSLGVPAVNEEASFHVLKGNW